MQGQMESQLTQALEQLGLEVDEEQFSKLLTYVRQMHRWNRTYNLTAITDVQEMLTHHIIDSLAVISPLQKLFPAQRPAPFIVDVGSGAGLPGIVLAIVAPDWEVLCVDSVEKKTAFIQQMRGVLQLPNMSAHHGRIQDAEPLQCDILISRAFSSLKNIIEWGGSQVGPGGYIAAMKGKTPDDEIEQIADHPDWHLHSVIPLDVPFLDAERCLILLKKQG